MNLTQDYLTNVGTDKDNLEHAYDAHDDAGKDLIEIVSGVLRDRDGLNSGARETAEECSREWMRMFAILLNKKQEMRGRT
ncbi:hypothetical protein J4462_02060 [Candidatus Pacearchaeota archaeon]|nr:hypothetical protein [Candidatus Pacearchaeota archaeon]